MAVSELGHNDSFDPLIQVWFHSSLLSITLLYIPLTAMQHIHMYPASVYVSTRDADFISQVYWSPNLHDFEILHYMTGRMVSNLL